MIGELPPGTELGSYRLVSVIGRGGMGVVYLAEDSTLERRVALKVLAPQYTGDANFRTRFERESRLAAALDHPNVVPIYEAGESNGVLFIAMRYVAGPDLRTVLEREGPFGVTRTLGIAAQLASALDAAHASGLIHRDVKPGNVLLAAGYGADGSEHVYLTDFGLTKHSASKSGLTQLGQLVGTIDYIAPEQISGGSIDGRADIYALGCVVFEMLTRRAPFVRDTDLATMAAHLHEPPPKLTELRPDLPPSADTFIAKALAKTPDDRYASGTELIHAARTALIGPPTAAAVAAAAAPTVIAVPPDRGPPTVLVAGAAAAAAAAAAPTTIGGPVANTAPPPSSPSGPPPSSASGPPSAPYVGPPPEQPYPSAGQTPPPYSPPGPASAPGEPPDRRPLFIGAALVIGLLLLAGVAYVFVAAGQGTPTARPTLIAGLPSASSLPAQPSAPVAPSAAVPSASAVPPTPIPTASPTLIPTSAPTPTPTAPPTSIPPTLPPTDYDTLLGMLTLPDGVSCTELSASDAGELASTQCVEGAMTREFSLFADKKSMDDAYYALFTSTHNSGRCPTDLPSDQLWSYNGDPASLNRGRYACYENVDNHAELNFTSDDLLVFGSLIGDTGETVRDVRKAWNLDDWVFGAISK